MTNISFKRYCWNIGTTSYRTKTFNANIERQLELMNEFWNLEQNADKSWSDAKLQSRYYKFMQKKDFVKGDAPRPDKDARQKTSGLVEIGLINADRKLTDAGKKLLQISESGDFSSDNELKIAKDSYIYLKQILKMSVSVDGQAVRPFILLIYFLSKLEYLAKDEYTYILPLCLNEKIAQEALNKIKDIRKGKEDIDGFICETVLSMDNYKQALDLFLSKKTSVSIIAEIGMNRKSREYDKSYYPFYKALFDVCVLKNFSKAINIHKALSKIKGKAAAFWRDELFSLTSIKIIKSAPRESLKPSKLFDVKDEKVFKKEFFRLLHLFKIKATLSDYFDLSRRYFGLTDTLLYDDDIIKFDILPKYFFKEIADKLYDLAFSASDSILQNDCSMQEIAPCLFFNSEKILQNINQDLGEHYTDIYDLSKKINDDRIARFQNIIKRKFTNTVLLDLLGLFESRKGDEKINNIVTDNADIPTIFEYVIGIIWYKISENKGGILDFMKLSLDANLLPKSHAVGGGADIVYMYDTTKDYSRHTVLLEATLTNKTNQRRAEMEPVSRHLGEYLLEHKNDNAYCVFLTNYLDLNVISDFRSRKEYIYYSTDGQSFIRGMKIIPLQISDIKNILTADIVYKQLYFIFDNAYYSQKEIRFWYKETISNEILKLLK
ncbi:MAG: AlwI family type II restriction endonuclease [Elusimicrobiota bacterium]|jgi:hypothetical protein|nr:AlwI family type II restriction endonuclease [Elusimicrobiota bacterium]